MVLMRVENVPPQQEDAVLLAQEMELVRAILEIAVPAVLVQLQISAMVVAVAAVAQIIPQIMAARLPTEQATERLGQTEVMAAAAAMELCSLSISTDH